MNYKVKFAIAFFLSILTTGLIATSVLRLPGPATLIVPLSQSSPETNLTSDPWNDLCPSFSPNGKTIAFSSNRTGSLDIWVMGTDGKHAVRITDLAGNEICPKFSPDGKKLAFVHSGAGQQQEEALYVADVYGSSAVRVSPDRSVIGYFEWKPIGSSLVYESLSEGKWSIWLTGIDGSGEKELAATGLDLMGSPSDRYPSWSPDGTGIVFSSDRKGGLLHIWYVNSDGSGLFQLTNGTGEDIRPKFNPVHNEVLFISNSSGTWNIWIMKFTYSGGQMVGGQFRSVGLDSDMSGFVSNDTEYMWDSKGTEIVFSASPGGADNNVFTLYPDVASPYIPSSVDPETYQVNASLNIIGQIVGFNPLITRVTSDLSQGIKMDTHPYVWQDGAKIVFQRLISGKFDILIVSASGAATPPIAYR